MAGTDEHRVIEILPAAARFEQEAGLATAEQAEQWRRDAFRRQMQRAYVSAETQRRLEWDRLEEDWLAFKFAKSQSENTVRNYRHALSRWKEFLATQFTEDEDGAVRTVELWEATSQHVRLWQGALRGVVRSESTVNLNLSSVSSFYSFVLQEKRMVSGVEIDMMVDRLGRARENPFKTGNLRRGAVKQYGRAKKLQPWQYDALLTHLEENQHTLIGARNHAMIRTYLHTGWRASEVLRMQWKHLRGSEKQAGTMIFEWRGKGGKTEDDLLPEDCAAAIIHYLRLAGRYIPGHTEGMQAEDFIFTPVRLPDMSGFERDGRAPVVDPTKPISEKTALRVMRTALKAAGVEGFETFRLHDLRHTFARMLLLGGANLADIQAELHHSSLATTDRYVREAQAEDPEDTYSDRLQLVRMQARTSPAAKLRQAGLPLSGAAKASRKT